MRIPRILVSRRRGRAAAQAGLSLLEVLIAAGIILVVAIGILPLLIRATANNTRGWEATEVSNFAKTELEIATQEHWDSAPMTVPAGQTTLTSSKTWDLGDKDLVDDAQEKWYDGLPGDAGYTGPADTSGVRWTQSTTLDQFSVNDIEDTDGDGVYEFNFSPLDGSTDSSFVHLKRVQVQLRGSRLAGPLGAGQILTVRRLKAF